MSGLKGALLKRLEQTTRLVEVSPADSAAAFGLAPDERITRELLQRLWAFAHRSDDVPLWIFHYLAELRDETDNPGLLAKIHGYYWRLLHRARARGQSARFALAVVVA